LLKLLERLKDIKSKEEEWLYDNRVR
jgi:hypothetical protein